MSSHNSRETQGHSVQSSITPDDIPLVSFPAWAVLALGLRDSYIWVLLGFYQSLYLISPCLFPLTSPALVLEVDAALGVGERCRVTRAMDGNLPAQRPVYLSRAKPTNVSGFSPSSSARYTGTAVKRPWLSHCPAFFVSLIPFLTWAGWCYGASHSHSLPHVAAFSSHSM